MEQTKGSFIGMNSNQLKIVALLAMTCDHVGKLLFPQIDILQIVGRLAFPIFAYMIAEGCVHTKSKKKYLLTMAGLGLICQIVYFVAMDSLYQCVLVTFSLSIGLIYVLDYAIEKKKAAGYLGFGILLAVEFFICAILPKLLPKTDFAIDYGLVGVLLPICIYLGKSRMEKILIMLLMLVFLGIDMGDVQWYALFAPLLLSLYNGQRGKLKMKHLFYIYYPLHLLGIYLIGLVIF